ncbi:sugar-binding domain-containing protein [Proteiniphilum sp.]|uniref:sugar-binding domain-containing protein n=1 Tax=Proteiniphilum sp. TaxID=1926877 RepID=UPI002B1F67DA|nr:sugar-binding domain-containing protein [Proteiniphilum sp.]MEA4917685.1 glycoside hydrolase family 2 TIM barrel-domain containing protein [Proteiniphilum sp.]
MRKIAILVLLSLLIGCSMGQKNNIDLAGEWQFRLDPEDKGIKEQWFNASFDDRIILPGSLQERGYGYDVGIDTKWTGSINDGSWFDAPEYEKYRQKGNVKVPFWLNPDKHYVGVAWYRKEINIPSGWKEKRIQLELERTHWETELYVDGVKLSGQNGMSTPHRYLLEDLKPGKHQIAIRVDNRVNINVGVNAHSVSDHTQSNWNGLVGDLHLSAKPEVYIDDLQVYPDAVKKQAKVTVNLKGNSKSGKGKISVQMQTSDGKAIGKSVNSEFDITDNETEVNVTVDAGKEVLLWSEHSPNLYRVKTVVTSSGGKDERTTQFGFRDFLKNGTRFYVNGQPVFLRGTLECCIFPLTGYPAMDNNYWTKIYGVCKEFGLNHVRFHSWCPPEAAFNVADSMGIYLQVECGGWTTVGDGGDSDEWFYAEGDRILKEYGNHPSFCMLAYGNEPGGWHQVKYLSGLVDYWKGKDNRRVYTSAAGWPYIENADYWNAPNPRIQAWGGGLKSIINAQPPRTDFDYRDIIKKDMPTVSHEIGQWCVYPNFKEIEKYTGVLKAKNFEIFQETLDENNIGDLADDFLYASGKLQTLCYKADIEAALRTPGFAGFQLLDLHDFPGQGTALVGVVDAFWDTKGYVDGKEYSMFCNQTVPLIRFPKMIWLNNEMMNVPVEFAHFGKEPIKEANITWTVSTMDNKVIGKGNFVKDLPLDNCIPIGNIEVSFDQIKEPAQLTVSVELADKSVKNQWYIWVYPEQKQPVNNQPYITSRFDNSVIDRLNKGENVLLLSPKGKVSPKKGGEIEVGFTSIFWNTAWTHNQAPHTLGVLCNPKHPALALFPNQGYSDYQWWDIVSDCNAMVMDDFPADFRPVVSLIDDWFKNRRLGLLFEAKVGKGKLMVCSSSLERDPIQYPAAAQFRQSILEYMSSDKFNPQKELQPELIRGLFSEK